MIVYDNPRDYPGKAVLRRWFIYEQPVPEGEPMAVCDTVDGVREVLHERRPGRVRLEKHELDDPAILDELSDQFKA